MRSLIFLIAAGVLSGCASNSTAWKPTSYEEQQYWKRILTPRDYLGDLGPRDRQFAEYEMSGGSAFRGRNRP